MLDLDEMSRIGFIDCLNYIKSNNSFYLNSSSFKENFE